MEGFNDVWANILNDDLLNAKDLNNVQMLLDSRSTSLLQPGSPSNQGHNRAHAQSLTSQPILGGNGGGGTTILQPLLPSRGSPSL